ncbi:Alpha-1,2 mannosyltransferase [Komagataella phaffii CBS 7435]|uniref:Alpha-1,2-mannosyltransferase n=2 Tax=Komagataella phaffii TaxID=460519 RepID=C4QX95_KOMPG|nr:Alpha-1,2-mannosyltransferase [Komagataella phaffii GS115]AOA60411.1 GQ67_02151T0 [Komagataella phaffii]CAH2446678.1 Alpha-1,2 mannosyltransferase [Komagataella phaffii CBS 7435]AOA66185.1 GQ68_02166T0 [Komagataella phaffii GS115]CAY67868.1 Alpha-1,2-mannosyltransferase [Komagataella phaffii GS115]CCA36950.1 Alpha-1,2 mannosyltransferase [Komagataella phaffii CBS 7435]
MLFGLIRHSRRQLLFLGALVTVIVLIFTLPNTSPIEANGVKSEEGSITPIIPVLESPANSLEKIVDTASEERIGGATLEEGHENNKEEQALENAERAKEKEKTEAIAAEEEKLKAAELLRQQETTREKEAAKEDDSKKPNQELVEQDTYLDDIPDDVEDNIIISEQDRKKIILPSYTPKTDPAYSKRATALKIFYNDFFIKVADSGPNTAPITKKTRKKGKSKLKGDVSSGDKYEGPVLTEDFLRFMEIYSDEFIDAVSESHSKIVNLMPESFPKGMYQGDGIVIIGGGVYSWYGLLAIRNLRDGGNTLPVELMLPSDNEYEPQLCEQILPSLNAKCIMLSDIVDQDVLKKLDFKGYQFKALSLLASSFENVLSLDSDNIPVANVSHLFDHEPFSETGLVSWPDFWRRTTNPRYYEAAGIKIGEYQVRNCLDGFVPESDFVHIGLKDIPLHDRNGTIPDASTESGQLLVNKNKHAKTLMLMFYYNFYGPGYYYPLLSQGMAGEGDKETFLAAANFFGLPFYQVKAGPGILGHHDSTGAFTGVAIVQYDPIADYELTKENFVGEKRKGIEAPKAFYGNNNKSPLFHHCNFPKLDPVKLIKEKKLIDNKTHKFNRMYGPNTKLKYDFEERQWKYTKEYLCEKKYNLLYFTEQYKNYGQGYSQERICKFSDRFLKFLSDNPIRIEG